jgi:hypothetical protein
MWMRHDRAQGAPQSECVLEILGLDGCFWRGETVCGRPVAQRSRAMEHLAAPVRSEVEVRVEERLDEGELAGRGRALAWLRAGSSHRQRRFDGEASSLTQSRLASPGRP